MNPEIIYEDSDLLVINKPAGLLVHKTKVSSEPTLVDWLIAKYPEIKTVGENSIRPGIVHRLDKETSGVLVVAKNQKAFEYLKNQFQSRQVKKTYLALVWGKIEQRSGIIEKPLGIVTGSLKRTTRITHPKIKLVKEAKTIYRVKKDLGQFTLLEVAPLTGRTHQIRAHLASIHHPVVGDRLYSKKPTPPGLGRIFLHAESLEITLPDGRREKFTAAFAPALKAYLKNLSE